MHGGAKSPVCDTCINQRAGSAVGLELTPIHAVVCAAAVKHERERWLRPVPRAHGEPVARHDQHTLVFYIATFMPRHVYINHVRRDHALQCRRCVMCQISRKDEIHEEKDITET